MANHASAAKRNRQNLIRKNRNSAIRNHMRRIVRGARIAIENKTEDRQAQVDNAIKLVYRAASKNIIKDRTASRTVARLMKASQAAA